MGDLDVVLSVGEPRDPHLIQRLMQGTGNFLAKFRVGVTGEQLQRARLPRRAFGPCRPGPRQSLPDAGLRYGRVTCFFFRRRAVYPSTIFISGRPMARLPAGTSFVITVSAAVVASLPMRTGATKIVSHEI